jgi:hypothetical protein
MEIILMKKALLFLCALSIISAQQTYTYRSQRNEELLRLAVELTLIGTGASIGVLTKNFYSIIVKEQLKDIKDIWNSLQHPSTPRQALRNISYLVVDAPMLGATGSFTALGFTLAAMGIAAGVEGLYRPSSHYYFHTAAQARSLRAAQKAAFGQFDFVDHTGSSLEEFRRNSKHYETPCQ